jgi:metastasis-associated protein MTA
MASNLYKVGDWVYCETSPNQPYVIRKIEELTKTACGNVEAKVICAFRRQDIPQSIMNTIDKYQIKSKAEQEKQEKSDGAKSDSEKSSDEKTEQKSQQQQQDSKTESSTTATPGVTGLRSTGVSACDYEESEVSELNKNQRYNVKHRELYYSKYTDTIAATTIRAKCSVLLFNEEIERYADFLNNDDSFFYHLTYDPYQKSIVADKGEIRVGSKYQAEVPLQKFNDKGQLIPDVDDKIDEEKIITERVLRPRVQMNANDEPEFPLCQRDDLEIMEWSPNDGKDYFGYTNSLSNQQIDKYLVIARSVGTFSRALDCNNSFKQPSLPLAAAAASRDITVFHAMSTLHQNKYDVGKAVLSLVTDDGPIICKDEMEDWSASEANLFSDGLEKYGKDFHEIRKEYVSVLINFNFNKTVTIETFY